jgi:Ca2+-binding RTX toxin-like protein
MATQNGTNDFDYLVGNDEDDILKGFRGNDRLFGGSGKDSLYGGWGNDTLNGGSGKDSLYGGPGNDTLNGEEGNDILFGGYGNDLLFDGDGDDILFGGYGNDGFGGGTGNDRYVLRVGYGTDYIDGFEDGQDSFLLAGDLTFEQLTITKSVSGGVSFFQISITNTSEVLMDVATSSVDDQITVADFISI